MVPLLADVPNELPLIFADWAARRRLPRFATPSPEWEVQLPLVIGEVNSFPLQDFRTTMRLPYNRRLRCDFYPAAALQIVIQSRSISDIALLLLSNASGAGDVFLDRPRISGIIDFASAGN